MTRRIKPSGALRDPQHEKFAQGLAGLKTLLDAHRDAGYMPDASNAKRIADRPDVSARVAQLVEEGVRVADIRRERLLVDLDNTAKADIADYYEIVDGEQRLIPITSLPRYLSSAIARIKRGPNGEVVYVLKDALAAQTTLLKYLGALPEAPSSPVTNIFNVLSADDQRAIADALEAAGRREAGVDPAATGERAVD